MKLTTVLICTIASTSAFQIPFIGSQEKRLIRISETEEKWVTEGEKWALKREGIHFADVTETRNLGWSKGFSASVQGKRYPPISKQKELKPLFPKLTTSHMEKNLKKFTSFRTRYYKTEFGRESSQWLMKQIRKIAKKNPEITVEPFNHTWPQSSIIARIPGAVDADKIVVVGAHQDSANRSLPTLLPAPGADDDGSGTVTILEAFRVLVENDFKPDNTIEFHWYAAEEGGLLGSRAIFQDYENQSANVQAMLQQDMTGYVKKTIAEKGEEMMAVIQDFVGEELTSYVESIIDTYCDIPYSTDKCGYACSDHASAHNAGYQSAFVMESEFRLSDPQVHSTGDVISELSFEHMLQHAKLTLAFAYELGYLP